MYDDLKALNHYKKVAVCVRAWLMGDLIRNDKVGESDEMRNKGRSATEGACGGGK